MHTPKPIRINKYLSEKKYASRREADRLISAGLIKINGKKAELGDKVSEKDIVEVSKSVEEKTKKSKYLAYFKPVGVVTVNPENDQKSIKDFLPAKYKNIFPIGRLDKASRGLIILTDDGRITSPLLCPEFHHEKEYSVKVDKKISERFLKKMTSGLDLGDFITKPCEIKQTGQNEFKIILTEGKKHQIRRMCEVLGYQVTDLKRTRIMNIRADNLGPGDYREISGKELEKFLKSLGLN